MPCVQVTFTPRSDSSFVFFIRGSEFCNDDESKHESRFIVTLFEPSSSGWRTTRAFAKKNPNRMHGYHETKIPVVWSTAERAFSGCANTSNKGALLQVHLDYVLEVQVSPFLTLEEMPSISSTGTKSSSLQILEAGLAPEQLNRLVSRFLTPEHSELDLRFANLTRSVLDLAIWHRGKYGLLDTVRVFSAQGISRELLSKARCAGLDLLAWTGVPNHSAKFARVKCRAPTQRNPCATCGSRRKCLCRKVVVYHDPWAHFYCWGYFR
jgi:hypothetical protein